MLQQRRDGEQSSGVYQYISVYLYYIIGWSLVIDEEKKNIIDVSHAFRTKWKGENLFKYDKKVIRPKFGHDITQFLHVPIKSSFLIFKFNSKTIAIIIKL